MFGWLSSGCGAVGAKPAQARLSEVPEAVHAEGHGDGFVRLNEALEWCRRTLHKAAEANISDAQQRPLRESLDRGERLFAKAWAAQGGPHVHPPEVEKGEGDRALFSVCMPHREPTRGEWSRGVVEGPDMSLSDAAMHIEVEINCLEATPPWAAYYVDMPPDSPALSSLRDSDGSRPSFQKDIVFFGVGNASSTARRHSYVKNCCRNLLLQAALDEEMFQLPMYMHDCDPIVLHVEAPLEGVNRKLLDEVRSCLLANLLSLQGGASKRLRVWVINAALFTQDELDLIAERETSTFVVTWRRPTSESVQTAFLPWLYGSLDAMETMSLEAISETLSGIAQKIERLDSDGGALFISEPKVHSSRPPQILAASSAHSLPKDEDAGGRPRSIGSASRSTASPSSLCVERVHKEVGKAMRSMQSLAGAWEPQGRPAAAGQEPGPRQSAVMQSAQSLAAAWEPEGRPAACAQEPGPRQSAFMQSAQTLAGAWEPEQRPDSAGHDPDVQEPSRRSAGPPMQSAQTLAGAWEHERRPDAAGQEPEPQESATLSQGRAAAVRSCLSEELDAQALVAVGDPARPPQAVEAESYEPPLPACMKELPSVALEHSFNFPHFSVPRTVTKQDMSARAECFLLQQTHEEPIVLTPLDDGSSQHIVVHGASKRSTMRCPYGLEWRYC
mmetsp:Transcript_124705/g.399526  ORF Transcript_124705/g.399526 Transcript_124705/m.399526 type:complete len:671 (-) Transcript_124705:180-2192(-)